LIAYPRLVRIAQTAQRLTDWEPLHHVVLAVVVGRVAADHLHQIKVHRLEVANAAPDEPVLNLIQGLLDAYQETCFFADFSDRGALEGFADLGRAFRQRPALWPESADERHFDRAVLLGAPVDDAAS